MSKSRNMDGCVTQQKISVLVNQNQMGRSMISLLFPQIIIQQIVSLNYNLANAIWQRQQKLYVKQNVCPSQKALKDLKISSNVYVHMCQVSTKTLLIVLVGQGDWGKLQSKWHSQVEKRVISNPSRSHQGSRVRMRQALSASPCSPSVKHIETQTLQSHEEEQQESSARCTPISFSEIVDVRPRTSFQQMDIYFVSELQS